jgi:hypothetical protein
VNKPHKTRFASKASRHSHKIGTLLPSYLQTLRSSPFPFIHPFPPFRVKLHNSLAAWVLFLQIRGAGSRRAATEPPSRAPVTRASSGAKRSDFLLIYLTVPFSAIASCYVRDGPVTNWRYFQLCKLSLSQVNIILSWFLQTFN